MRSRSGTFFVAVLMAVSWLAGCAAGRAGATAAARPSGPVRIEYVVKLDQPQTQMVDIVMKVKGWDKPALDVHMPVWRPGRYAVLDLAGGVRDVKAMGPGGAALDIKKTEKSSWTVATPAAGDVTIEYRIYANSLTERTRHVDDSHAFLSGSAVFMYIHELRESPVEVRVDAPDGWKTATGLERVGTGGEVFIADNYDVLVDSPLEIGKHDLIEFEVSGIPHEIAIWGAGSGDYQRDRLKEDFGKIVHETAELFGEYPYRRYVFMLHITTRGGGGTEHLNSTIMQAPPAIFETPDRYRSFLSLVAHEFHHTWNVKQLRPAGLKPYDYQRENYTDLLWVAEGTTTYYENVVLSRAGLMKPKAYFDIIATTIREEGARPGGTVQSLHDSSFDAWIKFNRPTPDAVNSTVSFYSKGELVNLALDMEVRRASGNKASLDSVMKEMYRRFPLAGPGFTTEDLLKCLHDQTGQDFSDFFRRYVSGTEPPPFVELLAVAGLELKQKEKPADKPEDPDADNRVPAYIGLRLRDADGLPVVTAVLADGPAYLAGLNADDQVVALNGRKLAAGDLETRLKLIKPGDKVRVTFLRGEMLREVEFAAAEPRPVSWTVKQVKEPTAEQRAVYESWLGQPWEKKEEKAEKDG